MSITQTAATASKGRLVSEFVVFFILAPIAIAAFLPAAVMFPALFLITGIGLVLLHTTDGFRWGDLSRGWQAVFWKKIAVFTLVTLLACLAVIYTLAPQEAFNIARQQPLMLLAILTLYPLISALPQELVFRPLFFRRYASILPDTNAAILLNAAIFSLAHLMYWSWVVAIMTFFGGLIFAYAYEKRGSFPLAVILHSIAGNIIFLVGLGIYFYSGNVTRPF